MKSEVAEGKEVEIAEGKELEIAEGTPELEVVDKKAVEDTKFDIEGKEVVLVEDRIDLGQQDLDMVVEDRAKENLHMEIERERSVEVEIGGINSVEFVAEDMGNFLHTLNTKGKVKPNPLLLVLGSWRVAFAGRKSTNGKLGVKPVKFYRKSLQTKKSNELIFDLIFLLDLVVPFDLYCLFFDFFFGFFHPFLFCFFLDCF